MISVGTSEPGDLFALFDDGLFQDGGFAELFRQQSFKPGTFSTERSGGGGT
jgi:hypothetical protein